MKRLAIILFLLCFLSVPSVSYAQFGTKRTEITEADGSPDDWPDTLIFPATSLTDNNNGSFTVNFGAGSQTPWTSDIDGGGYNLTNTTVIDATAINQGGQPVVNNTTALLGNITGTVANTIISAANTTNDQNLNLTSNVNFSQVNATVINQGGQPVVNNTTALLGNITGTVTNTIIPANTTNDQNLNTTSNVTFNNETVTNILSPANLSILPTGNAIIVPNGTTIRPASDGLIYFSASNNTSVWCVNTSSGRVGIGTTLPLFTLDIAGAGSNTYDLRIKKIDNPSYIALERNDTTISANGGIGLIYFRGGESDSSNTVGRISCVASSSWNDTKSPTNMLFNTTSNGSLTDSFKMILTSSGNLGIGTTAPATTLDVQGTGNFSNNVTMGVNLNVTGNVSGNYYYGNGSLLTGINSSVPQIDNWTIVNLSQGLQVANWIPDMIIAMKFESMINDAKNATTYPDCFIDVYNSSAYVYNATGGVYNSTMKYYEPNSTATYGANALGGTIYSNGTSDAGNTKEKAFDNNTGTRWDSGVVVPSYITCDFGAGVTKTILTLNLYVYGDGDGRMLKDYNFSGSADNSSWTELVTGTVANGTTPIWENKTFSNGVAYRYYKLACNSGWYAGTNENSLWEIQGQEAGTPIYSNYTIISNPFVATSNPTQGRFWGWVENVSAWTLNTDYKAYISNNNGTDWDEVTLYSTGTYGLNKTIVTCNATNFTGADNDVVYKISTFNNKRLFGKGAAEVVNASF